MTPHEAIMKEMGGQHWHSLSPDLAQECRDNASLALQALSAAGYVVVHRDITEPMVVGGRAAVACGMTSVTAIFNAMIDAHIDATEGPAP